MTAPGVLLLPGWLDSGPGHWQTRWQERHGFARVEQHDWQRPLRGDWCARLEEVVLAQPAGRPLLLAAHSLGCLLVAPPEIERADLRQQIPGWAPPARQRLPFASAVVASSDDPFASLEYATQLAADWGAALHGIGARGHINADSGLGDWPQGLQWLQDLAAEPLPANR